MKNQFLQFLFILLLSGTMGSSAVRWVDSHWTAIGQADEPGQMVEMEAEFEDDTTDSDEFDGSGADGDFVFDLPSATESHCCLNRAQTGLLSLSASIRQSQVNLFDSFQAPARFILFNTYQGYLS